MFYNEKTRLGKVVISSSLWGFIQVQAGATSWEDEVDDLWRSFHL